MSVEMQRFVEQAVELYVSTMGVGHELQNAVLRQEKLGAQESILLQCILQDCAELLVHRAEVEKFS